MYFVCQKDGLWSLLNEDCVSEWWTIVVTGLEDCVFVCLRGRVSHGHFP